MHFQSTDLEATSYFSFFRYEHHIGKFREILGIFKHLLHILADIVMDQDQGLQIFQMSRLRQCPRAFIAYFSFIQIQLSHVIHIGGIGDRRGATIANRVIGQGQLR